MSFLFPSDSLLIASALSIVTLKITEKNEFQKLLYSIFASVTGYNICYYYSRALAFQIMSNILKIIRLTVLLDIFFMAFLMCIHPENGHIKFIVIIIVFSIIFFLYSIFQCVAARSIEKANRSEFQYKNTRENTNLSFRTRYPSDWNSWRTKYLNYRRRVQHHSRNNPWWASSSWPGEQTSCK